MKIAFIIFLESSVHRGIEKDYSSLSTQAHIRNPIATLSNVTTPKRNRELSESHIDCIYLWFGLIPSMLLTFILWYSIHHCTHSKIDASGLGVYSEVRLTSSSIPLNASSLIFECALLMQSEEKYWRTGEEVQLNKIIIIHSLQFVPFALDAFYFSIQLVVAVDCSP